MERSEIFRFLALRTVGNFLVLFAIFGVLATFGPTLYFEATYRVEKIKGITYKIENKITGQQQEDQAPDLFAAIASAKRENILIPKDTEFSILIPKIGASALVIPNVDPANPDNFLPALTKGVAHARGTVFPGMNGNVYLFSHSTDSFFNVGRYNAMFYLLKNLNKEDQIVVFYNQIRHNYRVKEIKVADAKDVSYILDSQSQQEETLVLQTCWPPGTTWKRLFVIAKPEK